MKRKLLTMAIGITFLLGTGCQQQAASDKEKSKPKPAAKTEQPT
ncbi:hypothetical protein QNH39_14940 [Neobacillus novalis]|uniref:Uncharacterized protein n=1 Tax=Neobacillus novalis TaxID=220687 RepID=A0AA95MKI4_9BACI|nr:hypothetical protein [Neobacillus novalis]WHY83979.1 hypothetical protein QNH39_14940 [Neobacillus novalis]